MATSHIIIYILYYIFYRKSKSPHTIVAILGTRLTFLFCVESSYSFFILGLDIKEAIYPKKIAAAIPPAEAVTPPVKAPINPFS